jgi:Spy/CpxP family protein refolding chaperone
MTYNTVPNTACLFIAVLFLQTFAFAQPQHQQGPPPGGGMPPGDPVKELKRSLALTDEQAAKIEKIFDAQHDEMEKMMEASESEHDAFREQMDKNRKETDEKISSILTAEQKKKFIEFQKHRSRRPVRMPEPDDGPDHEI